MYSASYIKNVGSLRPDNWLVSPQLTLGGTMKVWLKGQDEDEFREHFAIYLSTTGDFLDAGDLPVLMSLDGPDKVCGIY